MQDAERDRWKAEVRRALIERDALASSHREWERRALDAEAEMRGMEAGRAAILAENERLRALLAGDDDAQRLRARLDKAWALLDEWGLDKVVLHADLRAEQQRHATLVADLRALCDHGRVSGALLAEILDRHEAP